MNDYFDFIYGALHLLPLDFFKSIFILAFDKAALKQLPTYVYLFWLLLLLFISFTSLYKNYRYLLKSRTIHDTPTAKIRSAAQGYTEILGTQHPLPNHEVIAPLSLKPCTWYRYQICKKNNKNQWVLISKDDSLEPILIKDFTGFCILDPKGATIESGVQETWYGFSSHPKGKSKYKIILFLGFIFGHYQYNEYRMEEGSAIYVLGNFSTLPTKMNCINNQGLTLRQPYIISNFTGEQLTKKYRFYSIFWLVLFLIFMPYSFWWLSLRL